MACSIKTNKSGVQEVMAPNGKPSKLFETLMSMPFIKDENEALLYHNELSKLKEGDFYADENGEPLLAFINTSETNEFSFVDRAVATTSYQAASANAQGPAAIEIGAVKIQSKNVTIKTKSDVELYSSLTDASNKLVNRQIVAIKPDNSRVFALSSKNQFKRIATTNTNSSENNVVGYQNRLIEGGYIQPTKTPVNEILQTEISQEQLAKNSSTTQRANTVATYRKAARMLGDGTVLDYGAGLGLGSDVMRNEFGKNVDSYEPNTQKWQGKKPPTYTKSEDINKKYDSIVSLNVVNVVPKDVRDFIVKDIFDKLKVGGKAYVSSRGWTGDIASSKLFRDFEKTEKKSLLARANEKDKVTGEPIFSFQKGFDRNELLDYVQEILGDAAIVEKPSQAEKLSKISVVITKVSELAGTEAAVSEKAVQQSLEARVPQEKMGKVMENVKDLMSVNAGITRDGKVTLYHRTDRETAERIERSKSITSRVDETETVDFESTETEEGFTVVPMVGDRRVGSLRLTEYQDGFEVSAVTVYETYRGLGIGSEMYREAAMITDEPIYSSDTLTEASRGVWESLVRTGEAEQLMNGRYRIIKEAISETSEETVKGREVAFSTSKQGQVDSFGDQLVMLSVPIEQIEVGAVEQGVDAQVTMKMEENSLDITNYKPDFMQSEKASEEALTEAEINTLMESKETEVQQKKNKNSSSISVRVGEEKVISATLSNETVPTVNRLSFTKDNVTNLPNFIKELYLSAVMERGGPVRSKAQSKLSENERSALETLVKEGAATFDEATQVYEVQSAPTEPLSGQDINLTINEMIKDGKIEGKCKI